MIPKIIHYCWFGGAPKPESVLRCIDSWKEFCPDYEIREWTEKDFDVSQNEYTRQAYEKRVWGFVPDYIRVWIVYHHGGIYLDTDVQILKSFDPLLKHKAFAGFEKASGGKVNFGQGFGAEAGNPVIGDHMHMYDDMQFILPDGSLNRVPSPEYTTQVLLKHGMRQDVEGIQKLEHITIYPEDYFCPKDYYTGLVTRTRNTYSIHHFDASWFTKEEHEKWKKSQWKELLRLPLVKLNLLRYNLMRKVLGENGYEKLKKLVKGKNYVSED